MADPVSAITIAAFAFAASKIASDLLAKKNRTPLVDEKSVSTSTRGSYVGLLLGRRRIGAHVAWVGDRTTSNEANAGGKGVTGSGSQQVVYRENAHHVLNIGPAEGLHKIWANGKILYAPAGGINRQTHPSGTSVSISGFGSFIVYWGEADQPIDTFLSATSRVGVASRWKFCLRIVWIQVRLGGFPTWPSIEYEPEVRPYKPGTVMGVNQATLPDRLSSSSGWIDNEFGPDPGSIFNITNGYVFTDAGQSSTGGVLKIAGDHHLVFPPQGRAGITGQGYVPFVNKLLNVVVSNYNSGETYFTPHGYVDISANYNQALTDATWVKTNVTVAVNPVGVVPFLGSTGADQTVYKLTNGGGFPNTVVWNAAHSTAGDRKLGRFRNRITFYVYRFGQSGVTHLKFGFIPFTTGPLVEHSHFAQMDWVNNAVQITSNMNSQQAKMREIVPPPDNNWRKFEIDYVATHGAIPSTSLYDMQVSIDTTGNSGTPILSAIHWDRDNGSSATGVTTIDFVERLEGVDDSTGTVQSYRRGFGPGGPNAAHIIDQLLFETFPHGAGLDRTLFDIPSLEVVGSALEAEGLRTNVYGDNGEDFESILASIFSDVGIMCSWDRITGKFVFVLVRDPNLLSSIPLIPEELIVDPLPERLSVREAKTADKAYFGFPDLALGYRDNLITANDDGRASIDQNQKSKSISLETVIDQETAISVADRRAQEVLVPISKYTLNVDRDAADFYPGQVLNAFDFDEALRVIEVKVDPKTRRTSLDVIADTYGLQGITTVLADSVLPVTIDPPLPDIAVSIVEIPAILLKTRARSIGTLRIRANATPNSGVIWISSDDLTYTKIYDNSKYVTGGTLLEAIPDGTTDIVTGPVIYGLGPDLAALSQTLTNGDWALGRQLLWVDDELFFLQSVVPLGENYYRLDGLKRAQYRTTHAAHSQGTTAFIVDPLRLDALYDPLVRDSQTLYVKAQPKTTTEEVLLSAVSSVSKLIAVAGPTSPALQFAEVPTGTVDGVNATFTLSFAPNPAGSLALFHNTVYRTQGLDYTLSGVTITYLSGSIPQPGDTHIAHLYQA